jgi:hypothetical protein
METCQRIIRPLANRSAELPLQHRQQAQGENWGFPVYQGRRPDGVLRLAHLFAQPRRSQILDSPTPDDLPIRTI